jgi:hypothetical protein
MVALGGALARLSEHLRYGWLGFRNSLNEIVYRFSVNVTFSDGG